MNILFLDDNIDRCNWFRSQYPYADIVHTSSACISHLRKNEYDVVLLDHDLGGEIWVDSNREDCGMEVVRWICDNNPKIRKIVIHSHNLPAAGEMMAKLLQANYDVSRWSFGGTLFSLLNIYISELTNEQDKVY